MFSRLQMQRQLKGKATNTEYIHIINALNNFPLTLGCTPSVFSPISTFFFFHFEMFPSPLIRTIDGCIMSLFLCTLVTAWHLPSASCLLRLVRLPRADIVHRWLLADPNLEPCSQSRLTDPSMTHIVMLMATHHPDCQASMRVARTYYPDCQASKRVARAYYPDWHASMREHIPLLTYNRLRYILI